jgi:hypothetical protein
MNTRPYSALNQPDADLSMVSCRSEGETAASGRYRRGGFAANILHVEEMEEMKREFETDNFYFDR